MPKPTLRQRQLAPHLRINLVGGGAIARWLLRPLLAYLHEHAGTTFEVTAIDGDGDKTRRLAEDAMAEFPPATVKASPEYLVLGNIADHIRDGDFVFACVDNAATIKLISDHATTLQNVTAISGMCEWCDGVVQLHVRRDDKNLTPPFANKYHPEILAPQSPYPGDRPASERVPVRSEPVCIATSNMTAALMVALFHRVLKGNFGKAMPKFGEYYLSAEIGKVVGRARTDSSEN